ncbi:MAG: hypothetical protein ABH880_00720 [Patescibacteria group bacterium]
MKKIPNVFIGFLQAIGLSIYVGLVGFIMWNSEHWFENEPSARNIIFVLILFVTSALMSALITLGYPAYLILKRKKTTRAIKIIIYTAFWLILFLGTLIIGATYFS